MKPGSNRQSPWIRRRKTVTIKLGGIPIGSGHPVSVQSMTNTDTRDPARTLRQIKALARAGCDLIRVAVPDQTAAAALAEIIRKSPLPVIADIHFDYRLALESIKAGAAGIRINPGNIGPRDHVARIIELAQEKGVCIRIGVNAGSLEKRVRSAYQHSGQAEAMVESALKHIEFFEKKKFSNLKISLKSSDVLQTVRAYRLLAKETPFPFHLGITEAGSLMAGTVKSSLGIGLLLYLGIGDTLRVSLTADPLDELRVAYHLLRALGLRQRGVEIISCPTCGRCQIDLLSLVKRVEKALAGTTKPLKVAIMGCVVNGPGEAREADIGIAGGKGLGLLFAGGKIIRKVPEKELAKCLLEEIARRENIDKEK
ncbi:MAG: flavodoxin-dependent (E)-4-hydroxy-3-methylbut-2-enyl-diphosphate synthase [Thermodesulfobacteriota bacterium]